MTLEEVEGRWFKTIILWKTFPVNHMNAGHPFNVNSIKNHPTQ